MAYQAFCSVVNMHGTSGKSSLFVVLVQSKYLSHVSINILTISLCNHLVFQSMIGGS
jgi:ATP/ADP translocase